MVSVDSRKEKIENVTETFQSSMCSLSCGPFLQVNVTKNYTACHITAYCYHPGKRQDGGFGKAICSGGFATLVYLALFGIMYHLSLNSAFVIFSVRMHFIFF